MSKAARFVSTNLTQASCTPVERLGKVSTTVKWATVVLAYVFRVIKGNI